jgi:hypothetical protein
MVKAQITIPLDIPDVRVLQTSLSERGEIMITIESTKNIKSARGVSRPFVKMPKT